MRLSILLLFLASLLCSAATPAKPWDKLDGVTFKPQRWDDGDSFHCTLADGNELILRLYFVDTCEAEKVYADRIRDQSAYFGITEAESLALGKG